MELSIQNNILKIELKWWEKMLSVRGNLEIHIGNIASVSTEKIPLTWKMLRLPGTCIPGVIVAGTYYSKRHEKWEKEFWHVMGMKNHLVLELRDEKYKRIILGMEQNLFWKEKIDSLVR